MNMENLELLQSGKRIAAPQHSRALIEQKIDLKAKEEQSFKIILPLLILALLSISVNVIIAKKSDSKQQENYFQSQLHMQLYHE